jgi:hypothetical protein
MVTGAGAEIHAILRAGMVSAPSSRNVMPITIRAAAGSLNKVLAVTLMLAGGINAYPLDFQGNL